MSFAGDLSLKILNVRKGKMQKRTKRRLKPTEVNNLGITLWHIRQSLDCYRSNLGEYHRACIWHTSFSSTATMIVMWKAGPGYLWHDLKLN